MKPKLFESLIQQNAEFKEHIETQKHKMNVHPFLKRYCELGNCKRPKFQCVNG